MSRSKHQPFTNDFAFTDVAIAVLGARARRLAHARDCHKAQQGGPDDQPCQTALARLAALTAHEEVLKADLDSRLAAHRSDPAARQLALDGIVAAHKLAEEERTILLTSFCFALSEDLSNFAFGDVGTGYGGNGSVEFYCRLLGAENSADRVRARNLFQPESRLIRAGLIRIETMRNRDLQPEDLLWCRVEITQAGFDAMFAGDTEPGTTTR